MVMNRKNREMWNDLCENFHKCEKATPMNYYDAFFVEKPTLNTDKFAEFIKNDLKKNGIVRSAEWDAIENNIYKSKKQ